MVGAHERAVLPDLAFRQGRSAVRAHVLHATPGRAVPPNDKLGGVAGRGRQGVSACSARLRCVRMWQCSLCLLVRTFPEVAATHWHAQQGEGVGPVARHIMLHGHGIPVPAPVKGRGILLLRSRLLRSGSLYRGCSGCGYAGRRRESKDSALAGISSAAAVVRIAMLERTDVAAWAGWHLQYKKCSLVLCVVEAGPLTVAAPPEQAVPLRLGTSSSQSDLSNA